MFDEETKKLATNGNADSSSSSDDDDDDEDDEVAREEYKAFSRRTEALHSSLTAEKFEWFSAHKMAIYCLARQKGQNSFNRARIVSVKREENETNKFRAFFVDFGDYADGLEVSDLLPIEERFVTRLPFQAIECSLAGIRPLRKVLFWSHSVRIWLKIVEIKLVKICSTFSRLEKVLR